MEIMGRWCGYGLDWKIGVGVRVWASEGGGVVYFLTALPSRSSPTTGKSQRLSIFFVSQSADDVSLFCLQG
jgi:hypothetical protein